MPLLPMVLDLPPGSTVAILLMVLLPVLTLVLYWIDLTTNDGYVSVLGRR
ncbi:hypothetical protein [Natronococcus sp. A-GB7]|nr:hypothetical protein [Natronococcus sp. A-GB7]MDG5818173.1 hypothetical protein [Natronococcus sp. A-GB7]